MDMAKSAKSATTALTADIWQVNPSRVTYNNINDATSAI
jgi:hypothetical protein